MTSPGYTTRRTPVMQLLAYPLGTVKRILRSGFALADDLRLLQKEKRSTEYGVLSPTIVGPGVILQEPEMAVQMGAVENVHGLRWWDLSDPLDGSEVSGFTLQPHAVGYNSIIDFSVAPDPAYYAIRWEIIEGGAEYWTTALPDDPPGTTGISWVSALRDMAFSAKTVKPLPRNQSFRVRVQFLGTARESMIEGLEKILPYWRLTWGSRWAIAFAPHLPPVIQEYRTNPAREGKRDWVTIRRADAFGRQTLSGAPINIDIYHNAGRLVVELTSEDNKAQVVYTDRHQDRKKETVGEVRPVEWEEAKLQIEGRGVPFVARLSEMQWGELDEELAVPTATGQGYFERTYHCNRRGGDIDPVDKCAFGYYADGEATRQTGQVGPSPTGLAHIEDSLVRDELGNFLGKHRYKCTLRGINHGHAIAVALADAEEDELPGELEYTPGPLGGLPWLGLVEIRETAMWGSSSPLVFAVALRLAHATQTTDDSPIDLRPAVKKAHERLADPALQPGAEWTVELDRLLLPECPLQSTGLPVGNNWGNYVNKYHPITVGVGWNDQDYLTPRLIGYIWSTSPSLPRYGDYPTTLILRDMAARLQLPAGIIDGRFAPLDLIATKKFGEGEKFYGWHAIEYILETALGPEVAERLQVYFDFEGRHKYMDLYKMELLCKTPPSGSGFVFPPPFGSSALDWIKKIAERDFAVFFFGQAYIDGEIDFVPCYGNYFEVVNNLPTIELPDSYYATGDLEKVFRSVDIRGEPSVDYNRVLAYGRLARTNADRLGGLIPALPGFSAEARIEDTSYPEQNIADTWERTMVIENPYVMVGAHASSIAAAVASWLHGVDVRHIGITCRGLPELWWGFKVTPKMESLTSDQSLNLDGKTLRVMRVDNDYDLEQGNWETKMAVADNPVYPGG